ncbi:MAG TPA: hypothetical protein VFA11_06620 [Acidimicrobiales bacterium]|nr:hypothetical protein [Acidimicrobiales bacterium]
MFGDRERPARVAAEQDRALRQYLRFELYAYSPFYRRHLDRAVGGPPRLRGRADLATVPPVSLEEITDPAAVVLTPDEDSVVRFGGRGLAARVTVGRLTGRPGPVSRQHLDPVYKPLLWLVDGPLPVACTSEDLDRMAELGRRWLEAAGLAADDTIVSILPTGAGLPFWQLHLGARRAGVSLVHLGPRASHAALARWAPEVVVGREAELARLCATAGEGGDGLRSAHTLIAVGRRPGAEEPDDPLAGFLTGRARAVLGAWAPPGARALWAQCRGGTGVHTWPAAELVEVLPEDSARPVPPGAAGELVWTSLAWKGSAFLRLRTGVAGRVDPRPCEVCARTTPRVIAEPAPS